MLGSSLRLLSQTRAGGPARRAICSVSAQKAASSSSRPIPKVARQSASNVACWQVVYSFKNRSGPYTRRR